MKSLHRSTASAAIILATIAVSAESRATDTDKKPVAATTDPKGTAVADKPQDDDQKVAITTTAQKRFENIQNVPLPVQVISPAQMDAQGVRAFQDLGRVSPSLTIRPAEHPGNANVSIRGVGTFAYGIGVESSVAVTVDGVALAFQPRAFTDLPDVAQIEVLRGPQSTLYGKAASAGLIKIMTTQPTDDFHVKANTTITEDSEYRANLSLSGPITDTLGYVLSTSYANWDGNVRNLFNNDKLNGRETLNTRAKLRWKASPTATFTLSGHYIDGNTKVGRPFIRMAPTALIRNVPGQTQAVTMPGVIIGPENTNVSNDYRSGTTYWGYGSILRTDIAVGKLQLLGLTSYDRFKLRDSLDHDDTSSHDPRVYNQLNGEWNSKMFTQEVRLLSPGADRFRYALGLYYAGIKFFRPVTRGPAYQVANWRARAGSRQIAAFGQVDWQFLPKLTATVGGRLQNERVEYSFRDNIAKTYYTGHASDTAHTYRLGLSYQANRDLMLFGSYSTGYKGQTYDLTTGFNQNRANAGPVKPETSTDLELGLRMQLFNQKMTFNLTYFNTDYSDLQAQTIETLSDGSVNYRLTNVGGLNTKGLELELAARPIRDMMITGGATYLDAKYTSFPAAQCYPLQSAAAGCMLRSQTGPSFQNLTGVRATQSPKWKASAIIDYSPALNDKLHAVYQIAWQYQSSEYYAARDPEQFQPAYSLFNAAVGVRSKTRRWEATLFVQNIFDKKYYPSLVNTAGNFGNNIATQVILPRDFSRYGGIRVGLNY